MCDSAARGPFQFNQPSPLMAFFLNSSTCNSSDSNAPDKGMKARWTHGYRGASVQADAARAPTTEIHTPLAVLLQSVWSRASREAIGTVAVFHPLKHTAAWFGGGRRGRRGLRMEKKGRGDSRRNAPQTSNALRFVSSPSLGLAPFSLHTCPQWARFGEQVVYCHVFFFSFLAAVFVALVCSYLPQSSTGWDWNCAPGIQQEYYPAGNKNEVRWGFYISRRVN